MKCLYAGYVGVRCDYYVCVLLVSERGLEAVKVHQTQHLITLSALRCCVLFCTVLYHSCPYSLQSVCARGVCGIHWSWRTLSHFSTVKDHPDNDSTSPAGSVLWAPPTLCDYCRWQYSTQNRLESEWNCSYNVLYYISFFRFLLSQHVSFMKLSSGSCACHMTRLTCSVCLCALRTISWPLIWRSQIEQCSLCYSSSHNHHSSSPSPAARKRVSKSCLLTI